MQSHTGLVHLTKGGGTDMMWWDRYDVVGQVWCGGTDTMWWDRYDVVGQI
jgi:hypothetical protein